jgi:hypothetical protein
MRIWRNIRIFIPIVLFAMLLMRVIWLQVRSYPEAVGVLAQGYVSKVEDGCSKAHPDAPLALVVTTELCEIVGAGSPTKFNQWLLLSTVFLLMLAARFATGSWTLAFIVGTMLTSRGGLLSHLGTLNYRYPIFVCLAGAFSCIAHHVRTGSILSALGAGMCVALGGVFDARLIGLALAPTWIVTLGLVLREFVVVPLVQRVRQLRKHMLSAPTQHTVWNTLANTLTRFLSTEDNAPPLRRFNYRSGLVLRTIDIPYLLWLFHHGRWRFWLAGSVFTLLALTATVGTLGGFSGWYRAELDVHYIASLVVILACAGLRPNSGLPSFQELLWLTIGAAIGVAALGLFLYPLGGWIGQILSITGSDSTPRFAVLVKLFGQLLLAWFEPIVLTLGVCGVYNLLKALAVRSATST